MSVPNLFVIGAARSGTTSIYHYLSGHSKIYVPAKKELDYFGVGDQGQVYNGPDADMINTRIIKSWEEYLDHYNGHGGELYSADISPWYLYSKKAATAIQEKSKDSKIIVILRDPVERAFSHYRLMRKLGLEKESSFWRGLKAEQSRMIEEWAFGWFYRDVGYYGEQLTRYFQLFEKDAIKVILFEDLQENPALVMEEIYKFLEIQNETTNRYDRYNAAELPRYSTVENALINNSYLKSIIKKCIGKSKSEKFWFSIRRWNSHMPTVDKRSKEFLRSAYEDDKILLEGLLARKLDIWY